MAQTTARKKSTTRILVGITALGAATFLASAGAAAWLLTKQDLGDVEEGSFLRIQLRGEIPDAPPVGGFFLEPEDFPAVVTEYAAAIRKAATDDRIDGIYLRVDEPSAGYAGLQEIRASLEAFRNAGKPCIAYAETFSMGSYYLASACDQVVLAPSGVSMVTGVSATVTYYAGAMEKLGVRAEMEHVGDFKSAVEPFERTGPSEAASEAMDLLLDGLWGRMVDDIARGRGRTTADVQGWVDRPALAPEAALALGMVDALAFPDVVRAHAHDVVEDGWLEKLAAAESRDEADDAPGFTKFSEYLKGVRAEQRGRDSVVAVVHADGPIVSGEAEGGLFGESSLADRTFAKWMRAARVDDDVKAVVLRVNSPGGSGLASDMMWREIVRTQEAGKPVVVSMGNYAASGGYFIAAPADWIVASPVTITGSIGVFGGKMNLAGTYEKLGLSTHTYERGAEADLFSPTASFSEGGRSAYRAFLAEFYEVFLGKVASGRDLDRDAVHAVAQGRVWTGEQALERRLVDELGGMDVALAKAAELASLEAGTWGVRRLPEQKGFLDLLLEDLRDGTTATAGVRVDLGIPADADEALRELALLDRILADGVAAVLPGGLRIE